MNQTNIVFGHECQTCNTKIGVTVVSGGTPRCRGCGEAMQAASSTPSSRALANVSCKSCNARYGMLVISGSNKALCKCGELLA
jgi:transcription elongation factor Elf1